MTGLARFFDNPATAPAFRAGSESCHLSITYLLRRPDFAGPMAGRTFFDKPGLRPGAMTGAAFRLVRDCNCVFCPIECIGEGDLYIIPEICTSPSPWPPGSRGECIEYISQAEGPEQVVVTRWPVTCLVPGFEIYMTYLVILGFFLGVPKHLVRFIDFLELLFCLPASFVEVRMVFPCKVPERFFEIVRCCILFYAKYL